METNNPLIYIVLPIYNWEKYFLEQLMSIYHQNYKKWYLIIVNDWSTDNSEKIARDRISRYNLYDKVMVLQKENWGLNSAITLWLEEIKKICDIHSTDSLVSYCDSDDIRTRDKLEVQVRYMVNNNEIWVSYHNVVIVNENWEITNPSMLKTLLKYEDNFFYVATFWTHVRATEIMFRAFLIDLILPMPIWFRMYQDTWSMYIFYFNKIKVWYINNKLCYYRQWHTQSLLQIDSKKQNKIEWPQKKYFDELTKRYPDSKNLFKYIIDYNLDRQVYWIEKKYPLVIIYVLMLFKYTRVFIIWIKSKFIKFIKFWTLKLLY